MRRVISALVINEPGVLSNVANMLSARGFNIDSLVVGRTENANLSRMTMVVNADENTLEQVRKQLAKLIPVVNVREFTGASCIERELLLIVLGIGPQQRSEVLEVAKVFGGKAVDIAPQSITIELAARGEKIDHFIELMRPYAILEVARTGAIAMSRGVPQHKRAAANASNGSRIRNLSAPAEMCLVPN